MVCAQLMHKKTPAKTVITETIMIIIIIMIIIKQRTGGVDWIRDVYLERAFIRSFTVFYAVVNLTTSTETKRYC